MPNSKEANYFLSLFMLVSCLIVLSTLSTEVAGQLNMDNQVAMDSTRGPRSWSLFGNQTEIEGKESAVNAAGEMSIEDDTHSQTSESTQGTNPAVTTTAAPEEPVAVSHDLPRISTGTFFSFFLLFRFISLLVLFFPVLITFPWWVYVNLDHIKLHVNHMTEPGEKKDGMEVDWEAEWWVNLLVRTLEKSGATFIKLGQYASSRTDLIPPSVCKLLAKLQSNGTPHSIKATRKVIKHDFGVELEDIFEDFDEEPVGVGAIAQVHRAYVKKNVIKADGTVTQERVPCAIKILHPGVRNEIDLDLAIVQKLAHLAEWLIPDAKWLSLPDEVSVFAVMMRAQADLRVEASNLKRFHDNFLDVDDVSFPAPIEEYVTSSVLVEEFIDAIPISKFLGFHEDLSWTATSTPYDIELARIGIQAFLKMLIVDNFVHTDLHPGNILVTFRKPPTEVTPVNFVYRFLRYLRILPMFGITESELKQPFIDSETLSGLQSSDATTFKAAIKKLHSSHYIPHLIFLDAGLVSTLSDDNLTNLHDLLEAVVRFSAPKVSQLLVSRSKDPKTVVDLPGFELEMKKLLDAVKASALRLSSVSFGGILKSVFDMVRQHRVRLEGEFVNVGVSVVLVEGIGRRLDPGVDLLGEVGPVLRIVRQRDQEKNEGKGLSKKINTYEWWALQWWSVVAKVKEGLRLAPAKRNTDAQWKHDMFPGADLRERLKDDSSARLSASSSRPALVSTRLTQTAIRSVVPVATSSRSAVGGLAIAGNAVKQFGIQVANLHPTCTVGDVESVFAELGKVLKCTLKQEASGTGTAEVIYDNKQSVMTAIGTYNNQLVDGYTLKVTELKTGLSIAGAATKVGAGPAPIIATAAGPVVTGGLYSDRIAAMNTPTKFQVTIPVDEVPAPNRRRPIHERLGARR
ncbi:hypothetical protein HDV05_008641 [Chytridiales sp. JEL 0842]|nr:hypothetical protein HDV05_008641 [Chytridiales sp. JEL 0842]